MQSEFDCWAEFDQNEESDLPIQDRCLPTSAKQAKLDELQTLWIHPQTDNCRNIQLKSSLITQTIEVIKQSEVLQSLIETFSNINGSSNYLLNPCQMIPEVDFPPENAADLMSEYKMQKPMWFIPDIVSHNQGFPSSIPKISSNICRQTLRKAMCGLLCLAGFTDCTESAIILLTDTAEEFLRSFIEQYRSLYNCNSKLMSTSLLQLLPLEQAYTKTTGTSLTQLHNYYKHKVVTRNRFEIAEFNSVLEEYDKLMKESQSSMQKHQELNSNEVVKIIPHKEHITTNNIGHIDITNSGTSNNMVRMTNEQRPADETTLYSMLTG